MIRWFGKVVPPEYVAGFVLVCVLSYTGPYCFYAVSGLSQGWNLSGTPWLLDAAYTQGERVLSFVLGVGACAYGAYRAIAFAPFKGTRYYLALIGLAYDGSKPLLKGPLLLAAQDVALLLFAELATGLVGLPVGIVVVAFFAVHMMVSAVFLFDGKRAMEGYLLLVGVVLSLRFVQTPWVAAGMMCLFAVLERFFVRRLLREFPWDSLGEGSGRTEGPLSAPLEQLTSTSEDLRERLVGWPLGMLAPEASTEGMGKGKALAIGVLVGLGIHSLLVAFGQTNSGELKSDDVESIIGLAWVFFLIACFGRIGLYVFRYRSPITLFGRLASGRLIIPSYDIVFVTPLAAAGAFAVLTSPYCIGRIPFHWLLPLAAGLSLAILLGGGPSFADWRCTGEHKMRGFNLSGGQYTQT